MAEPPAGQPNPRQAVDARAGAGGRGIDPERARPPVRPATVRLASRGRGPVVLSAIIGAFLALALWKPWAGPAAPRPLVQAPPTPHPTEPAFVAPDPLSGLRDECDEPAGWRVYSHEAFLDQVVRVWRSVQPATAASGPLDPSVPVVPAGPANRGLGYCAPWTGADSPPADSTVSAWRVRRQAGQADAAVPLRLRAMVPIAADVRGALYRGPGDRPGPLDGRTSSWAAGRYVFAVRSGGFERWWAVEILPDRPPPP